MKAYLSIVVLIMSYLPLTKVSLASEVDIEQIRRMQPRLYLNHVPNKSIDQIEGELGKIIDSSQFRNHTFFNRFLISGVRVYDSKLLIDAYTKIIGQYRPSHKELREIRNKCDQQDIYCLASLTLDPNHYKLQLYSAIKYNFVIARRGRHATLTEYQRIINALDLIDWDQLKKPFSGTTVYLNFRSGPVDCSKRSVNTTMANAGYRDITIYPMSECISAGQWGSNLLHELGHIFSSVNKVALSNGMNVEFALSQSWRELSHWKILSRYHHQRQDPNACFVSPYSRFDAMEDFAESFMFYILSPDFTKELCPDKALLIESLIYE